MQVKEEGDRKGNREVKLGKVGGSERNIQAEAHRGLSKTCEEKVGAWERMCKKWEEEAFPKKSKSPYKYKSSTMSEAEVRKRLENEENERQRSGGISLHNTSPWAFVAMGLDLEDMQRRIHRMAKGKHVAGTDGNLLEQRRILQSRIRDWEQILPIFMPGVPQYRSDIRSRATSPSATASHPSLPTTRQSNLPEDEEIWLPSRILTVEDRARLCVDGLADMEQQLRDAQLRDSLDSLRMVLRMKTRMVQFKNANIRGQRDGTRSRAMIDRVHERARVCVEKYWAARAAKLVLSPSGAWEQTYRVMEDGDVRGYQDPNRLRPRQGRAGTLEDSQLEAESAPTAGGSVLESNVFLLPQEREKRDGSGETRRTLSWIWLVDGQHSESEGDEDVLRTEWARSRARANRAREEVMLLKEEMRRILAFLDWKGKWWLQRISPRVDVSKDLAEGLRSYAEVRADHRGVMPLRFGSRYLEYIRGKPFSWIDTPKSYSTSKERVEQCCRGRSRNPILEVDAEDMDDEEVGIQFTTTATEDLKVQADIMVSISHDRVPISPSSARTGFSILLEGNGEDDDEEREEEVGEGYSLVSGNQESGRRSLLASYEPPNAPKLSRAPTSDCRAALIFVYLVH
ncbi:hypothetical protein D9613_012669 [Agrocybe pediades]|uniref:Uncharacterized protein n=1 Tax=Agrocybe pediades TaxID=84607 RepID=A0A8H4VPE4_9AGAR|nr:hypothetical protein D9613_012669 [Agrocybe pediades]